MEQKIVHWFHSASKKIDFLALRCFVWVTSIHLLNTEVAYPISRNTCCWKPHSSL